MTAPQKFKSHLAILFCRYPVPGHVKTRLIPDLGPVAAANIHRELTETILKNLIQARAQVGFDIQICFGGGSFKRMSQWLGPKHAYERQVEGDLGRRMYSAFHGAFEKGYQRVILVGSDIPEMKAGHIREAFHALEDDDLVLAPSTDGGYWLVGLKKPSDVFQISNWGNHNVLEQTMAQAKIHGLSIQQIETLSDIDTMEDLRIWRPGYEIDHPYLSIIIPTLNEASNIDLTLKKILHKETEIIVVDGESLDDTKKRAEEYGARVASSPPRRAVQLNLGANMAKGDVLLFLHADTHPPDHFVECIFMTLMNQGTIAGAFRFKTDLDRSLMKTVEYMTNMRSRIFNLPYGDQGLFLTKKTFDAAGGFPDVPVAEDLYFVRNLAKRGRIRIASLHAVTSARRWRQKGILYTTVINSIILIGCLLGVPPERFASLYK